MWKPSTQPSGGASPVCDHHEFHIVLSGFTIGLANFLLVLEAFWLKSGRAAYLDINC